MTNKIVLNEEQEQAANHVDGPCLVLACPGSGKCIVGDSIVILGDGFTEIRNDKVEWLRAFDAESLNRSSYSSQIRISSFVDSGIKPTLKIITEQGYSLQGTAHHPIAILNNKCELEWKCLQDIKIGDFAAIHLEKLHDNPMVRHPTAYDLWYTVGLMLGDGYLTRENELSITTADNEIEEIFVSTFREVFGYNAHIYYDQRRINLRSILISSKSIKQQFQDKFGDFCHLACEKRLTDQMLASGRGEIGSLIQGLFDTDGYVSGANVEITLCSKKLIEQLQIVLLRFGIFSCARTKEVDGETYYRLYISGEDMRRFEKNIGFRLSRKSQQLKALTDKISNPNRVIPNADYLVSKIYEEVKNLQPENYDSKLSHFYDAHGGFVRLVRYCSKSKAVRRGLTETAAYRLISACEIAGIKCSALDQLCFIVDNFAFSAIESIEDGGNQHVYDYCVDKYHNFIANGFVNHNTRCVVERTCRLIEKGIAPRSILSITFTNKAAGEMKERTAHRLGAAAQQIYISTFHALCANILRKYGGAIGYSENMTICDSDDQESRMKQAARQLGHELNSSTISWLCQTVNTLREELIPESQWDAEFQTNGKPQFASIAREYISRLRASGSTDFSGLLSETLRLFDEDKATLQKLQSRFSYIQVDETQDTNYAQFKIFLSIGIHNNLFIVGDSDQCQPAGTMVETITGPVPIEELDPKKHKLISYDRRSSIITGRRHGFSFQKSSRLYDSALIQVKAGGFSTTCTPNHKWTVKLNNSIDGSHVVYLMRQGTKWRVGSCAMYKSRGKKAKTMFGPSLRARQERADGLWLLTVCANACEARAVEQIISCKYGIPMTCFHTDASACGYTDYVFRTLTELENKAKKCLSDYGRLMEYPIWTKSKAINQDHGKRIPLMVHACNLLEGYMQVPVPTKGKDFEWSDIELDRQFYKGRVYSLDVNKYEHYIADGIVTHNSIYGWRGARYKNIQDFINDKKAKIIVLPKNYRSTPEIVAAANALIKHNKDRQHEFDFTTVNASGEPVELYAVPTSDLEGKWIAEKITELIEDDGYKPEDIAVLYRLNSMSRSIEQGLIGCGISYEVIGGMSFFDRMEIRDAIAMLKFYINHNDGAALSRFINSPTRGIGEVSIGKIENFARDNNITLVQALSRADEIFSGHAKDAMVQSCKKIAQVFSIKQSSGEDIGDVLFFLTENLEYKKHLESEKYVDTVEDRKNNLKSFIEACSEYSKQYGNDIGAYLNQIMLTASSDKKGANGSVSLMTLHASKGLEFKVVFMPCLVEGLMPHKRAVQEREGGLEEERRLCYVGMTRAQERLILSYYSKSFVKSYSKSAYKSAGNYATVMPSVFIGETSMLKHCKKGEVAYGKL